MRPIVVDIPGLHLVSEANRASHEHWRVRQKRAKAQRACVGLHVRACFGGSNITLPLKVTIFRIGPRRLDWDNAVGSAKHTIDAVAKELGVNDNDPRISWDVQQEKGPYAVRIRIEAA
jgi:hypothetical protein